MYKALLLFLFLSTSSFSQDSFLDRYNTDVASGAITESNAVNYIRQSENQLYSEVSELFDDLQFKHEDGNYFSPKDKVNEFSSKWKNHTKNSKLNKTLDKIIADPDFAIKNNDIKKLLKENRKFCQILRENFYIFSKNHEVPKKLNKVVKPFGRLNDAIVAGNENLVQVYAAEVQDGFKKLNLKKIVKEFDYVTKKEFNEYFKTLKRDFNKMLAKSSHSIHDFHWIRKQHKKFLVIYMGVEGVNPHPKAQVLDNYITKIGDMNDIYVDIEMRYNLNLENHTIKMDKNFRKQMTKTLSFLQADMKTINLGPSCYSFFKVL
jgi:hypothetical protein